MKFIAGLLLILPSLASASIADFDYTLQLDLPDLKTQTADQLDRYKIAFDAYEQEAGEDCKIDREKNQLNCAGKGTVYPGLDEVAFRLRLPEGLKGSGKLEYKFQDQEAKNIVPLDLKDGGSVKTQLKWE